MCLTASFRPFGENFLFCSPSITANLTIDPGFKNLSILQALYEAQGQSPQEVEQAMIDRCLSGPLVESADLHLQLVLSQPPPWWLDTSLPVADQAKPLDVARTEFMEYLAADFADLG